jgi:hypothetical protein
MARIIDGPEFDVQSKDFEFGSDPYSVTAWQNSTVGCSDRSRKLLRWAC